MFLFDNVIVIMSMRFNKRILQKNISDALIKNILEYQPKSTKRVYINTKIDKNEKSYNIDIQVKIITK